MGKKAKKNRFNQVVDLDITYSNNSVASETAETALAKLNLSKEKLSELQRIKAQLPSAPQSIRIEEEIARIPDEGPFRVVLVNVAFTATRDQIEEFFLPLKPTTIKIVEDDGKFRGFCFVDFANRTDLAVALDKNGSFFLSRKVTMRLADNPIDRDSGNRRAFGGNSGFPASEGWATRKPRATEEFKRGPELSMDAPSDGSAWRRGVARPTLQREEPTVIPTLPAWSKASNIGVSAAPTAPSVSAQQELPQRPTIKLAPRTKPKESEELVPTSRNASIFGDAKPVDTAARDLEMSEKKLFSTLPVANAMPSTRRQPEKEISAQPTGTTTNELPVVSVWEQRKKQSAQEKLTTVEERITTKVSQPVDTVRPTTTPLESPDVPVKSRQNAWKKPLITNE